MAVIQVPVRWGQDLVIFPPCCLLETRFNESPKYGDLFSLPLIVWRV